jgi:aspartate/methionine/tyrosine aminotransferase
MITNRAVNENFNQYCRSAGEINLVQSLAKHYSPLVGREIDPLTEVATSVGATEGLFAIMQALLNEGDEVSGCLIVLIAWGFLIISSFNFPFVLYLSSLLLFLSARWCF